ncbi:hypothetical protein K501DRAFT_337620 [Backusella circina FSU 941]|nr:hypothetical protein K501DRAFT_337620 [Backusella circina FSU 941]
MLQQDYPKKIQPRSSSTRQCQEEQDNEELTEDKVDVEASRILMDLANQEKTIPLKNLLETMTLNNEDTKQQQQQDPIMLLAAAAAAIDDGGKYKKRSYERREIKLQSRNGSSKRKSITQEDDEEMHDTRRHSKSSVSPTSNNTWNSTSEIKGNEHAFSWQYLSMKKNPRIKRNAMHAYITYMIYTDMAHSTRQQNNSSKGGYNQKEQEDEQKYGGLVTTGGYPNNNNGAIMKRPLTDFLFEPTKYYIISIFTGDF